MSFRTEFDSLGDIFVPQDAYYGAQTQRALENFPVSEIPISQHPELIRALAMVKKAAAVTNCKCGLIPDDIGDAIIQACDEILAGRLQDQFVVDVMQGGAGTSSNMNANEVIANRALELIGKAKGQYEFIHPNDHVNCSQSTNDAYATSVRLSLYFLNAKIVEEIGQLKQAFELKANEFSGVIKLGRTQLQDAVPMTADAEILAYAVTLGEEISRAKEIGKLFLEVNLGGTAIGSSIGASDQYQNNIVRHLADLTDLPVVRGESLYEASWDMGAFVLYSGMLKRLASKLSKISNDLRLLSSGPFGGFGEYELPARQPGSSIMPAKVNPVIPEMVNQVCFRVFGADTTVTFAAEAGQLQLNAFEPVIHHALSDAGRLLLKSMALFRLHCVDGMSIRPDRCKELLESSMALATSLVPHIGYEKSVTIAKSAMGSNMAFIDFVSENYPELTRHLP